MVLLRKFPFLESWSYSQDSGRDERIDMIRGMVMFVLLIVHVDFFSWYNLLAWERIGVVSGGEGFVILSGIVLGMVYRKKISKKGWRLSVEALINRSAQLYRLNVAMIIIVALISLIPLLDASSIMTFHDRGSGKTYPLFPSAEASPQIKIAQALLLKIGPHQFQIIGLYVVLVALAPLALFMFEKKKTLLFLSVCWIVYFKNWAFPSMPTGAQFEYAFPVLTWQLTFFHGLAFGYHRRKILEFLTPVRRRALLLTCWVLFIGFFFFTQNNPHPTFPDWAKISVIPADTFNEIYRAYFLKNRLGILRLVNYFVVLVVGYYVLTYFWKPIHSVFGWWLIPVGQASLYVFFIHVFLVMLIGNIPFFWQGNIWLNTLGHTLVLMAVWLLVRTRFLYGWIPR